MTCLNQFGYYIIYECSWYTTTQKCNYIRTVSYSALIPVLITNFGVRKEPEILITMKKTIIYGKNK